MKDSLIGQLKRNNPDGIKMAIGITMYNEKWEQFIETMSGII